MKSFIIRLFQVVWVLGYISTLALAITTGFYFFYMIGFIVIFAIFILVLQYLVLSTLNPFDLFTGELIGQQYRKINLFMVLSLGVVLLILSIGIGQYYIYLTDPTRNTVVLTNEVPIEPDAVELPYSVVRAYNDGKMNAQQMAELEADVKNGLVYPPKGIELRKKID